MRDQQHQFNYNKVKAIATTICVLLTAPISALAQSYATAGESFRSDLVEKQNCFMVAGTEKDPNNAFLSLRSQIRNGHVAMYGHDCTIFNSYKELIAYVNEQAFPDNTPILVIQEGHGSGGGVNLNGGWTEPEAILSALRQLTIRHRVAFIGHSCYSGNLLTRKLIWDADHANSPADAKSIDRLCMWTDSLPGRLSVSSDARKIPSYSTLEEVYLSHPEGIMTSAAWNQSGYVEYMKNRINLPFFELKKPSVTQVLDPLTVKIMREMSQVILDGGPVLSNDLQVYIKSAKFVLNPNLTDAQVIAFLGTVISAQNKPDGAIMSKMQEYLRNEAYDTDPSGCKVSVQTLLRFSVLNQTRYGSFTWSTLLAQLKKSEQGIPEKNLSSASPPIPQPYEVCADIHENRTTTDWANWVSKWSSVGTLMKAYAKSQDQIGATFNTDATANEIFEQFAQVNSADLNSSNYYTQILKQKAQTFASIVGNETFKQENIYTAVDGSSFHYEPVGFEGSMGASGNVLPAFTIASTTMPAMADALDARHRNACRSIRLNPESPSVVLVAATPAPTPVPTPVSTPVPTPVPTPEPSPVATPEPATIVTPSPTVSPDAVIAPTPTEVVTNPDSTVTNPETKPEEDNTLTGRFGRFFKKVKKAATKIINPVVPPAGT